MRLSTTAPRHQRISYNKVVVDAAPRTSVSSRMFLVSTAINAAYLINAPSHLRFNYPFSLNNRHFRSVGHRLLLPPNILHHTYVSHFPLSSSQQLNAQQYQVETTTKSQQCHEPVSQVQTLILQAMKSSVSATL